MYQPHNIHPSIHPLAYVLRTLAVAYSLVVLSYNRGVARQYRLGTAYISGLFNIVIPYCL